MMKYRRLGKTELQASVIGLGTWQFGGEWGHDFSQKEVNALFDAAREVQINLIDTAECYGDHLSEQFVGEAIRSDRDRWIVATKFGHRFHRFNTRDWDLSPGGVQQQLEASLRALQTDVIDLYQFHSGSNEAFDNDALWTMLAKQRQAGKIRFLGISVSASQTETNAYQTARATQVGASVIQVVYNRLQRTPEEDVFPLCEQQDLGVLARVPLASGLLSGKYAQGVIFPPNDIRSQQNEKQLSNKLEEIAHIQRDEVPVGTPMATWALAWCLKHPVVTSVIPGCKTPEQLRQNAAAAEFAAAD